MKTINLSKYINWLKEKNLASGTIEIYGKVISKYYGNQPLTTANIVSFVKQINRKLEPITCRSYVNALVAYTKFQKNKEIDWEKVNKLIPKIQPKFYSTVNQQELELLKKIRFEKNGWLYKRNNLILDFLFYSGLRASELVNIKHRDWEDNSLRIHGKGNKVRYVFIPDFLVKFINPNAIGYLFVDSKGHKIQAHRVRKIIYQRAQLANLKKWVSPHTFRRSLATNLYNRGGRLETIQKQLSHSRLDTTLGYIHNDHNTLYQDYSKLFQGSLSQNQSLKDYSATELLAELSQRSTNWSQTQETKQKEPERKNYA